MRGKSELEALLDRARHDRDVLAVMLFGSAARGDAHPGSDLDVCLVLRPGDWTSEALAHKRLGYVGAFDLDVHVFQALPLYIRHRVLKECRVFSPKTRMRFTIWPSARPRSLTISDISIGSTWRA